jgi:predicted Zn finger-like uncharacterized protein
MYITCPECTTKFAIKKEQIGKTGRKVKCSKCSHIWHYTPGKEEAAVERNAKTTKPTTESTSGINVPALLPTKVPSYLVLIPITIIGLMIIVSIILFNTNLRNHGQLDLRDMQIIKDQELGRITVSYKVHNSSAQDIKMPLVRVRLIDKDNKIIKSRIDDHTHLVIAPNKCVQVKTEFAPVPESAENVDIMMGNKLDFLLR